MTIAWRKSFDACLLDELQQLAEHQAEPERVDAALVTRASSGWGGTVLTIDGPNDDGMKLHFFGVTARSYYRLTTSMLLLTQIPTAEIIAFPR